MKNRPAGIIVSFAIIAAIAFAAIAMLAEPEDSPAALGASGTETGRDTVDRSGQLEEERRLDDRSLPASEVPQGEGDPEAVREFLLSVENGPEVLTLLQDEGVDLARLGVPPPFEEVRDHFVEALVWDEGAWDQAVTQEMRWPTTGFEEEMLYDEYGLDRDLELAAWQLEEFTTAAEERNSEIRPLVDEYLARKENRYIRAAQQGDWDKFPYKTLPGRKAWDPGPPLYSSRGIAHRGWTVRLSLLRDEHMDLVERQQRHLELVRERDRYLRSLVTKFESELDE